jgi:flagellar protein FliO/FliZ
MKSVEPIGTSQHLLSVTLALIAIIAIIFAISWFIKKMGQGAFSANNTIKMIAAMPLGTRERIALIDVGGQHLLLGITPTAINTLHVFTYPVDIPENNMAHSEFSQKLISVLKQKIKNDSDQGQK